jgi:hypothetical protein
VRVPAAKIARPAGTAAMTGARVAGRAAEVHEVVTDAVAAVDGMIAAPLGEVGKLAAAVATARRPTGAARALVSFVRTRTPIARPGSHAFPSRRYLTT